MTLLETLRSSDSRLTIEDTLSLLKDVRPKIKALSQPLQDIDNKYKNLTPENMGTILNDVIKDLNKVIDIMNAR